MAYSCGGAGGGKIRNTRAAGGVPPSGGIAWNAGKQGAPVDVDHAWAASRSVEELDVVVGNHVQAKKQYDTWTEEDEAGYQIYLQEQDMEKRTYRAWYLIANPRKLPKEIVNQELAFRFKLFPDKMDKKK